MGKITISTGPFQQLICHNQRATQLDCNVTTMTQFLYLDAEDRYPENFDLQETERDLSVRAV